MNGMAGFAKTKSVIPARGVKGLSLLELLIALALTAFVITIAWRVLADQRGNMVGIRQRLRSQAVAREALKTLEAEVRIAGFGQKFQFDAGGLGRIDSIALGGVSECTDLQTVDGASVLASDGASGGNDTLTVAIPNVVDPTTGTDCSQNQWTRYFVDADTNLVRVAASSQAGLAASTDRVAVAEGVEVFQIRLSVSGGGKSPAAFLNLAGEICCAVAANFTVVNGTRSSAGSALTVQPAASSNWSLLSVQKSLKAGERWRDSFFLEPNASFFKDLRGGASLRAGLFNAGTGADASMPILTLPSVDSALSVAGSGLGYAIDLVVPVDGNYRLGFEGTSKAVAGTQLVLQRLNAVRKGVAPSTGWWKDPSQMGASDWSGVQRLEVVVLARSESMDDARASKFTGLANFKQGSGPVGEFAAADRRLRSVFDHIYPVGNNGAD